MAAKGRRKAATHKLPESIPLGLEVSDMTKKVWVFGQEIGSGGCGSVYFGAESTKPKDFDYVIKVEYHEHGPLFAEMHCMLGIAKPKMLDDWTKRQKLDYLGMSPCHATGSFEYKNSKYRFMVLDRYGKDLQKLLEENGKTFPLKTVCLIGISVMNVIEYIHSCGYLHGDIKAANLLLGRKKGSEDRVYLVDLGLACKFTRGGSHRKDAPDPKLSHNGTMEFISRDGHRGAFARRGDFEILCYNLLYWLVGRLPWETCKTPQDAQKEKEKYMEDPNKLLRALFPSGDCPCGIAKLLHYVCDLSFEEEPDYTYCRTLLNDELKKLKCGSDSRLVFKSPTTAAKDAPEQISDKENNVKPKSAKKSQAKRKEKEEFQLEQGIIPTPAMLEIINKKNASDKTPKMRKKN